MHYFRKDFLQMLTRQAKEVISLVNLHYSMDFTARPLGDFAIEKLLYETMHYRQSLSFIVISLYVANMPESENP